MQELIDINFNFFSDSGGKDPDCSSPTLKRYHRLLWTKTLPNGKLFELNDNKYGAYLYHNSDLGEFYLGSDAITHSYRNQKKKQWLIQEILDEVIDLFDKGSNIGGYIIFPNKKIDNKFTINQARGVNQLIDDRFDLTLECIRRFYNNEQSPLYDTFLRYKNFFDLFESFDNYINFFLLEDLIDKNKKVKFYLPFDHFESRPGFRNIDDYREYKSNVIEFITARILRIKNYSKAISNKS